MRSLWGVVVAVLVLSSTGRADPTKVGNFTVVFPCAGTAKKMGAAMYVECSGAIFAAEPGVVSSSAYVTKVFDLAKVPAAKRATQQLDLGGTKATVGGVEIDGGKVAIIYAIDKSASTDGVGFFAMGKKSEQVAVLTALQKMVVDTLKASAPKPAATTATQKAGKLAFTVSFLKHEWSTPSQEYFQFTRDRWQNTMMTITGGPTTMRTKGEIMYYDKDYKEQKSFGATPALFSRTTGVYFSSCCGFEAIDADPNGNLIVTLRAYHDDNVTVNWPLAVYFHRQSGKIEMVVDKKGVFALGDGTIYGANAEYRLSPNGDVWAIVRQYTGKTRIAIYHREGENKWSSRELAIPANLAAVRPDDFNGSVDSTGGYVYYDAGYIQRLGTDGKVTKLAPLAMPGGVYATRVVATPDGAYWIGVSMKADVTQYSTPIPGNTREINVWTFASVSGATKVIRVVPDGKGGGAVGFIDGAELEDAFIKGGAKVEKDSIMQFGHANVDWSNGGLALYDVSHQLLATIVVK